MDKQQTAPYRQRLAGLRAELLERLAEQRGGVIGRAEAAAEQYDHSDDPRAQQATERELAFAIDELETTELAAIDAALARIEDGTYGECTDCGVYIAPDRLHASPEAQRCLSCQEKFERRR